MKNKFRKLLLLVSVSCAAVAVFAACGNNHKHTYSDEWSWNNEYHWHDATCEHTSEQSGKAKHDLDADGKCSVCDYEQQQGEHQHSFAEEWTWDSETHWHAATCGHTDEKGSEAAHNLDADGKCSVCDYEQQQGEHQHSFAKEWSHNSETHWHAATCDHDVKSDEAAHQWNSGDVTTQPDCGHAGVKTYTCTVCGETKTEPVNATGEHQWNSGTVTTQPGCETPGVKTYTCTVCGETKTEPVNATGHSYSSEWSKDENGHWHQANCEHNTLKKDEAPHTFESGKCKECDYPQPHDDAADFVFEANGNNYIITGLTDEGKTHAILTIPAQYSGKAVTAIADYAFMGCTTVEKLTFSEGIVEIGRTAFSGCTTLKEVKLPESLKTLKDYVFDGCSALKTINLPAGLTALGDQVFNGCKALESIVIPAGITEIPSNTFLNCAALSSVTLPAGLKKINSQAFSNCTALKSIELPNGLTYVGSRSFLGSGLVNITVPASVTSLDVYAFNNCLSLESAEILANINYIFGSLFEGCEKLASLTIPFLGTNVDPSAATVVNFGYVFGSNAPKNVQAFTKVSQNGKYYYVPSSLTQVKVLRGTIAAGSFDGCSNIGKIDVATGVKISTYNFKDCTAVFYRNGEVIAPTLTNVKLSAALVEANETVTLSYTATSGSTVTVSVKKNGAEAQDNVDYTYTAASKKFVFKTAGEFTVTVKAVLNQQTVEASATITVELPGPKVTEVKLSADKAMMNSEVTLSYNITAGSAIVVTVMKGEIRAVSGQDYTYDEGSKTFIFKTAGMFTVTVTATLNEKTASGSATITVMDPDAAKPNVNLEAVGSNEVAEGAEVKLQANVTYTEGDSKASETYRVFVQRSGGDFEEAATDLYAWVEGDYTRFQPLVAGVYKIELTAMGALGGSDLAEVTITATVADITLALGADQLTNGWVRATLEGSEVAYTVEGYYGGYNVTFASNVAGATAQAAASALKVVVSASEYNTVIFTVTYTHKTNAEKVQTLEIPVSFVSNVASAPVLGADPFGGTYGKLIPSTGLMLYFDVTDGNNNQLTYDDIKYEIVEGSNTTAVNISTGFVADNKNYPFVLVEDWSAHNAKGEVVVKLTATKNGQTAVSTKTFTVEPLSNPSDVKGINAYFDAAYPGARGDMDMDIIMEMGNRENAVISKEGLIVHRSNGDWNPQANIMCVSPDGANNFQVDFEYTILGRRSSNNKASVIVNYRTGSFNGWNGSQTAFYAEGGATEISAGSWGDHDGTQGWEGNAGKPSAAIGSLVHIRLTHTVEGNRAYFAWTWSYDGQTFNPWYSYNVATSTQGGNMGSPVYSLQFRQEDGCFRIGNVKLTIN